MLRKGSSASLEEGSPRGAGHLFIGPERSRRGLTHHDEFGLSHVESGSRVSVRSAELQCRTTLICRRRDLRAQPAHHGAGWSKDYIPVKIGGHQE